MQACIYCYTVILWGLGPGPVLINEPLKRLNENHSSCGLFCLLRGSVGLARCIAHREFDLMSRAQARYTALQNLGSC